MSLFQQLLQKLKSKRSLGIIVLAAVLFLLILGVQNYYTHNILTRELERRAETELTMKAILVKSVLNTSENSLHDHMWDAMRNLNQPDSLYDVVKWMLEYNPHLVGAGMGFVPYYFKEKGRLYEVYAQKDGDSIKTSQIAGPNHDYTQMSFFKETIERGKPFWSDPYVDEVGIPQRISTYSLPVHDSNDSIVGVFALDMSLDWLSDTINSRHMHPSSFVVLLTMEGKPIVLPTDKHVKRFDAEQVIRMINDSTYSRTKSNSGRCDVIDFTSEVDGSEGCIFHAHMKGKPYWQLAVVNYDKEIYHQLDFMTINVLILLLAACGLLTFIIRHFAKNVKRLHEANLQQERIGSELRIASQIQNGMLPKKTSADKIHEDIDLSGSLVPAREVGGDLYDYFLRDEKLFFCIGDVSGKGVPSALVMAVTQALFHAGSQHVNQPNRIMQTINRSVCHNNERNMFVTFFIGILDIPTGRLRYCNAGHDTPLLIGPDGEVTTLPVKPNLPTGVMADFKYESQELQMEPGTTLFLYTDGLTEAMDIQHRLFGLQRVKETLAQCHKQQMSASQTLDHMAAQVHNYVGGAEQSDDLTMLALNFSPVLYDDLIDEEIVLDNDVKQVPQLNAFVHTVTEKLNLSSALTQQIKLAVEEAVVNVMQYAYPKGESGKVSVVAKTNGICLKFIITDSGSPFDPTAATQADTSLSVEERPIGGLGIFLVREMMNSINYERHDGKNILTLRKYINNQTDKS